MRTLKTLLIAALLTFSLQINAQNAPTSKHEIGLSFANLERDFETLNRPMSFKWVPELYYSRHFSKLEWISRIGYGSNAIDDNCKNCADQYYGTGRLKEFNFSSGFRYHFFQSKDFKLLPFLESGVYYQHTNYSGDFDGGFSGAGTTYDRAHWSAGWAGRFGLSYRPTEQFVISAFTTVRAGWGTTKDNLGGRKSTSEVMLFDNTLLQLGVGYRF